MAVVAAAIAVGAIAVGDIAVGAIAVGVVVVVCGSRVGTMATTMEAVGGRHLNWVKIVGLASKYESTSC